MMEGGGGGGVGFFTTGTLDRHQFIISYIIITMCVSLHLSVSVCLGVYVN